MMEIERKFLVKGVYKNQAVEKIRIVQAYLCSVPERTVRIRIYGEEGFLTIKGKSSQSGLSRYEWEKKIPLKEAEELLGLCEPGRIEKYRYKVPWGNHTIEVDEFEGENKGLVLAEVELQAEDEQFNPPAWLDEEVTGNKKYYNAWLSKNPFCSW